MEKINHDIKVYITQCTKIDVTSVKKQNKKIRKVMIIIKKERKK